MEKRENMHNPFDRDGHELAAAIVGWLRSEVPVLCLFESPLLQAALEKQVTLHLRLLCIDLERTLEGMLARMHSHLHNHPGLPITDAVELLRLSGGRGH